MRCEVAAWRDLPLLDRNKVVFEVFPGAVDKGAKVLIYRFSSWTEDTETDDRHHINHPAKGLIGRVTYAKSELAIQNEETAQGGGELQEMGSALSGHDDACYERVLRE
jgi:hypothetical protein